jgi:hypothetical protein
MGLPLDPVICDEDPVLSVLPSDEDSENTENAIPSVVEEYLDGERKKEPGPMLVENEEPDVEVKREGPEDTVE